MRIFLFVASTSFMLEQLSSWYCIHCSTYIDGRLSGLGYCEPSSHIISTISPISFIPPFGNSLPYWLKVMLPYFEIHLTVPPSGIFMDVFASPLRFEQIIPASVIQS